MSKRLNVLLITVDDMNCDSVGCFGNPMPNITPNIDRLAAEGMRLEQGHITVAVCQPSRSVLLTGRYPHHNGARGFEDIDCGVSTLTEKTRAAGYYNGIIGKEDHVAPREKFCWDTYVRTLCEEMGQGRDPEVYYEESKKLFQAADREGKPFFAMINSHDPHRPFAGSEDELKYFGRHYYADVTYEPEEVYVPGCLPDLPDVRRELAWYYASVHRADQTVGRILDALRECGHEDDTMVLFLSDNGMALPYAKTNCYLHSTHSPYIVRWPGHIKAGTVSGALINGVDYTPTVLDILALDPIQDCDGASFKNTLLAGEECHEDIFTLMFKTANNHITKKALSFPMRCVQDKRFIYIFNGWSDGECRFLNESTEGLTFKAMEEAGKTDPAIRQRAEFFTYRVPEELYDKEVDPHALHNLLELLEYRDILERMRRKMLQYMRDSKDGLVDDFYCKVIKPNHLD